MSESTSATASLPTRFYVIALVTLLASLYLGYQAGQNSDATQALRDELAACLAGQVKTPDAEVDSTTATQPVAVSATGEAIPVSPIQPSAIPSTTSVSVPPPSEN